jgi:hypothetical protein
MIDFFPDSATLAATVADPRFALAVAISILSGMVRGFSGFGAALVYVPLMSAVYGPRVAAPSFLVIDFFTGLPLAERTRVLECLFLRRQRLAPQGLRPYLANTSVMSALIALAAAMSVLPPAVSPFFNLARPRPYSGPASFGLIFNAAS